MPVRTTGGVFSEQILTGSLAHFVVCGADFSGAINQYGQPVPNSAAEIIFTNITESAYVNIMNPNEQNLSFALEAGRSTWNEFSLTAMVQSLGNDVGSDHLDLTQCVVKQVPYIWGCGPCPESFLDLTDTPSTYAGAAGYVVTVNNTEDGLIFIPAAPGSNAFAFVEGDSGTTISAIGAATLNFTGSGGITVSTDGGTNTVTITGNGSNDYIPISSGAMTIGHKYFVTGLSGTVTLPALTGSNTPGQSITVAKMIGSIILVSVGDVSDFINTDLGITDAIEFDATQELVFIVSDANNWQLQIGSKI
jgi:hypothetical protein